MDSSITRHLLILMFVLLAVQPEAIKLPKFPKKVVVQMENQIPGGVNLTVHCKSKNDDLGIHMLPPGGSWAFSFQPNMIWLTTLYFCSFEWPGTSHYYDIYVEKRDYHRCSKCFWNIRSDGPCLFNWDTLKYDLCDHWNNNPPASL